MPFTHFEMLEGPAQVLPDTRRGVRGESPVPEKMHGAEMLRKLTLDHSGDVFENVRQRPARHRHLQDGVAGLLGLLLHFFRIDVLEEHRQPVLMGMRVDPEPGPQGSEVRLELHLPLVPPRGVVLLEELSVHRVREDLPQVLPQHVGRSVAEQLLTPRVEVREAPLVIHGQERLLNAAQDPGGLLRTAQRLILRLPQGRQVPRRAEKLRRVALRVLQRGDQHVPVLDGAFEGRAAGLKAPLLTALRGVQRLLHLIPDAAGPEGDPLHAPDRLEVIDVHEVHAGLVHPDQLPLKTQHLHAVGADFQDPVKERQVLLHSRLVLRIGGQGFLHDDGPRGP